MNSLKSSLATLFLFGALFPQKSHAQAIDPTVNFKSQIENLTRIMPVVERPDLARVVAVRSTVNGVLEDINTNVQAGRQPVTFQTLRLIQGLIIQYRYSKSFFGWTKPISINSIYSPSTEKYLTELQNLSIKTEQEYGYDDSPYTQITANTFRQMQKILKQLEDLAIDAELKQKLRDLWQPIGQTIAIAEQGDRPKTFKKAIEVIELIRTYYPYFDRISSTNAGFSSILEVQGLAEFYAEFAQMEN